MDELDTGDNPTSTQLFMGFCFDAELQNLFHSRHKANAHIRARASCKSYFVWVQHVGLSLYSYKNVMLTKNSFLISICNPRLTTAAPILNFRYHPRRPIVRRASVWSALLLRSLTWCNPAHIFAVAKDVLYALPASFAWMGENARCAGWH